MRFDGQEVAKGVKLSERGVSAVGRLASVPGGVPYRCLTSLWGSEDRPPAPVPRTPAA